MRGQRRGGVGLGFVKGEGKRRREGKGGDGGDGRTG